MALDMSEKGKMMSQLSPKDVQGAIEKGAIGGQAAVLAGQLLDEFRPDVLSKGIHRVEGTTVLWAVSVEGQAAPELVTRIYDEDGAVWAVWEAPQPEPRPDILADAGRQVMERLDGSDLYVAARELPNFSATAFRYEWTVNSDDSGY